MALEIGKRLMQYIAASRGSALFSAVLLGAFCLVAANAIFNQPGKHPQPFWKFENRLVTHTISKDAKYSVPVRRVETTHFPAQKIPIPQLRPSSTAEQKVPTDVVSKPIEVNIANAQRLLHQLGFYKGAIDGLMGPQTILAVKKFERSKGLPQNANISPSLLLLLQSAVDRAAVKTKNEIATILGKKNLTPTANKQVAGNIDPPDRAMVTRIQVGLINYGSDEIIIDGVMDHQTKVAIKQFQARFDLEVNGVPSRALIRKLESVGALTRG